MGPSVPKGPSDAQIKTEAKLEEERVKFENEKRLFIERVGSYEAITRDRLAGERSSFEAADFVPMNASGLYIPQKFDPTFDPTKFAGQDFSWFNAPNLGISNQWTPTIPTITPDPGSNQFNQNPRRQLRQRWMDQGRGT